jgi:EmrB/QacA subfamily drug resistance transporter
MRACDYTQDYIVKEKGKQVALIALAAVSIFMATLDYSMLNISLPGIAKYFDVKLVTVTWIPLTYLLIITSSLLGFGKLGDVRGYKKLFVFGIGVFVAGTFLCAVSPKIWSMIVSRVVQSVGEAMFSPAAIALITTQLPERLRGRALGIMALSQGVGLSMGPVLGSLIDAYAGWRYIFTVNIPIGLAVIFFATRAISGRQPEAADKRFDILGAGLVFTALSTFLFALNSVTKLGLKSPIVIGCFVISAISMFMFIVTERRTIYPLVDLSLFKNKNFSFSGASVFLATFVYMGMYFLFPFYLEMVRAFPVTKAGMVLMLPPIMMMIIAPFSGKLSDTIGSRIPCSVGMAFATAGSIMLTFLNKDTPFLYIVVCQLVMGVALGMFLAPNNRLVMASAPADKQGVASGIYKTLLNTGNSIGLAASPIILMFTISVETSLLGIALSEVKNHPDILMKGFRSVFIFEVFVCVISMIFSLMAKDREPASH